jgi:predicted Zn-dependent peptidase
VKEHTLANGMKVLLLERHQSPTIALFIRFRVGAVDENLGMTGTAHLLEHMLFKGTKTLGTKNYAEEEKIMTRLDSVGRALDAERGKEANADPEYVKYLAASLRRLQEEQRKYIVKDEIESVYSQNGAVGFNAMTSADATTYVISLPSNRLELWARIESDRILNPVLREFYSERDVVLEERRRSYDSQPDRKLSENFLAAAFMAHPYGRPVIGWPSDIPFLERSDAERFFRTFYSPANTVIAAVGDLRPDEALATITKYFERIPAQVLPPPLRTREPEQTGERRVQVFADASPQVLIGFHKPNPPDRDDTVCDLIDGILTSGRTSRFYRKLVEEEKVAVAVSAYNGYPGERYPNLFTISGTPRHPHTAEELEGKILRELDLLKREPVSPEELNKIKNQVQAEFLRQINSNSRLAYWLTYGQALFGDWRYSLKRLKVIAEVTPEDIRRVAQKYFNLQNRTVAVLTRLSGSSLPAEKEK